MIDVIPAIVTRELRRCLMDRRVVVLGAAPLPAPLAIDEDEVVVAVNGGISSFSRCEVWVVNAWGERWPGDPVKHRRMIAQAKDRSIGLAVYLSRTEDAALHTTKRLVGISVVPDAILDIQQSTRVAIETLAGARRKPLGPHALSAGLTAVCIAAVAGAATIRMEGFSWTGGYAYHEGHEVRGHAGGDRLALPHLEATLGRRLTHSLTEGENDMAKTTPATRPAAPAPAAPAQQRAAQPAAQPRQAPPRRIRVRAKKLLQYHGSRILPQQVFVIEGPHEFRPNQMVIVDGQTPIGKAPRQTAPAQLPWMQAKHQQRLGPNHDPLPEVPARRQPRADDPLGADGDEDL